MTPTATDDETQIEALKRDLTDKTKELEARQRENLEQKNYIFTLSNRLTTAQMECDEIRHCKRAAAAHKDDLTMQQVLRHENYLIKCKLEEIRTQQQGFEKAETDSLGPSCENIREEFSFIKIDITDACSSVDADTPVSADIWNIGENDEAIESCAQRISRCSFNQLASSALENGVSELQLLRSIAAVGICDLVFESPFPHFIATESPLLDQYRKQILTKGNYQDTYHLSILLEFEANQPHRWAPSSISTRPPGTRIACVAELFQDSHHTT